MLASRPFYAICLALLVMCLASAKVALADQNVVPLAESLTGQSKSDFEFTRRILTGRTFPLDLRRDAANRLLQRGWLEGINELLAILADSEDPQGQLAVAQALAETLPKLDVPPKSFIDPLIIALSAKDEKLRQAAASAVASYSQEVLPQLERIILQPAPDAGEATRLAAVAAVERIKDKRSVKILIDALDEQNVQLSTRCRAGLEHLTGIRFGDNNAAWRGWWQQYKDKDLAEWLQLYLLALDNQNRQLRSSLSLISEQLRKQIEARWQSSQDKPRLLDELLANSLDDVRLQALSLARDLLRPGPFPLPLQEKVRQMVQMVVEPSAPVRALAADLLRDLRDKQAGKIILKQLPDETDPKVRASFAGALGYVGGAEAVQPLIDLLADPAAPVVGKAALALGNLASAEDIGPSKAQIVQALLGRYQKTVSTSGPDATLRSEILSAMVQVGSPSFQPVFIAGLQDPSALTRAAAVEGLRKLPPNDRRSETLASVRPLLADPDRGVRLQVLLAIEGLGDAQELETLQQRLDPKVETDPNVREEVWRVITTVLTKADLTTLKDWEGRISAGSDANRQEQVLRILENRLVEGSSGPSELISIRERLGDCLSKLQRWEAAAGKYRLAYEQTLVISDSSIFEVSHRLALKMLDALLHQGAFEQVGQHLKGIANQPPLEEKALDATLSYLQTLVDQADTSKKVDAALGLISALDAASPPGLSQQPLAERFTQLKARVQKLQQQTANQP